MFIVKIVRAAALVMLCGLLAVPAMADQSTKAPAPTTRPAGAATKDRWDLVWGEQFDGTTLDPGKWGFDYGNHLQTGANEWQPGWGNGELQFYTRRPENAFVRDGMLHLVAIKEPFNGCAYTSARVTTHGKFSSAYGRFEFRAKLPTGKGIWPAIWLQPEVNQYGPWASSGEIDLLEARGQEPNKVLGTLHYGSKWPANVHTGKDYIFPHEGSIAEFHVYALEWDPGEIRWYVDDELYQTQNFWWSCSNTDGPKGVFPANEAELNPWPAPFNHPFYITMNLAVGGQFLGSPDRTTPFPAEMLIDYVRVYKRHVLPEDFATMRIKPRGPGQLPFEKP